MIKLIAMTEVRQLVVDGSYVCKLLQDFISNKRQVIFDSSITPSNKQRVTKQKPAGRKHNKPRPKRTQ